MTQDEITRIADMAFDTTGTVPAFSNGFYTVTPEELQRFAALVADSAAAKEREACIDIVAFHGGSVEIEAAIRARGKPDINP